MKPYFDDGGGRVIYHGDCRSVLATLEAKSVNCCVTSPPYFGLRDYGHAGQIGLEPTPDEYVAKLVEVFREVKRVLRDDGTVWLNLGDSYAGSGKGMNGDGTFGKTGAKQETNVGSRTGSLVKTVADCKPKDIIGIPWRVAFALQADGWYLRQDIIWHKPNPMPESVLDRCTKAHEYIFLLSKQERYYFDSAAIAEPAIYGDDRRPYGSQGAWDMDGRPTEQRRGFGGKNTEPGKEAFRAIQDTRNKRDVWTVPSAPFKGAHFATFPPELIKPCILAGCPKGGTVLEPFCGSGTTLAVAKENGCKAIGVELNKDYIALAARRLQQEVFEFSETIP